MSGSNGALHERPRRRRSNGLSIHNIRGISHKKIPCLCGCCKATAPCGTCGHSNQSTRCVEWVCGKNTRVLGKSQSNPTVGRAGRGRYGSYSGRSAGIIPDTHPLAGNNRAGAARLDKIIARRISHSRDQIIVIHHHDRFKSSSNRGTNVQCGGCHVRTAL